MRISGATIGIEGALAAFPRRLAAREVSRQGGQLRRGMTRRTGMVVFGRGLLTHVDDTTIETRRRTVLAAGATPLSENGFLRLLGSRESPANAGLSRQALLDQSGLAAETFDLLALFDAFEADTEPFAFRDLILARKYAGLVAGGAGWGAIVRSVHRSGPVASLTALSLHTEGEGAIYARHGARLAELDGQHLLPLDEPDDAAAEEFFEAAEEAEGDRRFADAAAFYGRCLALDPGDSVAAYNRANCQRELGEIDAAAHGYAQAIKLDPDFVEAWFNYAGLLKTRGQIEAARTHLERAVAIDPDYGDAVYNLATLEYSTGDLGAARRWWSRYLELDQSSEWARLARRGIEFADLQLHRSAG
ncbi:MAG: tetratricopeptide repeat protein [Devosia sp.]|nr:tetratricopeptide repeat protein [Devosia sp.]